MLPKMNPRQMQHMMKRMGIQQQEINATKVIIVTDSHNIVITDPQVSKVNMMGQETWQVVGEAREEAIETAPEINEDDIATVMEKAGVDRETAEKALNDASGDLAQAIIDLQ